MTMSSFEKEITGSQNFEPLRHAHI